MLVAATHSGAGKTTVTRVLLAALRARGLAVQPFKVGPDFIDPMYHSELAGRPSINLDVWMMGEDGVRRSFERWRAGADVAVVEAMGALFDGADGGDDGSAAHVARALGVRTLVVVDVWGMTRTTAALMDGMARFDPSVPLGGFVLNRVGSEGHRRLLRRSVGERRWRSVAATVDADPGLEVPERHLGLLTPHERDPGPDAGPALRRAAAHLDVARVLGVAEGDLPRPGAGTGPAPRPRPAPRAGGGRRPRLAVARDAAFCFTYEENLRALAEAGFDLVDFSPVAGDGLPAGTAAVHLGGGYPESFAAPLAANDRLRADLREAAEAGLPVYGECGGLVYLGRSLRTSDGRRHEMSGVLPVDVEMDPAHLAIRYVELTTRHASLLGPAGTRLRGQEFHQSRVTGAERPADLFDVRASDGTGARAGYRREGVVASYVHLHLSRGGAAASFVAAARAPR